MSNWNNNGIINAGQVPAIASGNLADIPAYNIPNMLFVSMDTQALYANDGAGFVLIGGPGTGTITGSGTAGKLTKWTGATTIGDSIVSESGSALTVAGTLTATQHIVPGGLATQFLKADGSLDANTYLTTTSAGTTYVPYTGANANVNLSTFFLTATKHIVPGGLATEFLKADGTLDSNTYLTTTSAGTTYVPYTGANANVNLGVYNLNANVINTISNIVMGGSISGISGFFTTTLSALVGKFGSAGNNASLEVAVSTGEIFRADAASGAFRIVADQTGVNLNGIVNTFSRVNVNGAIDSAFALNVNGNGQLNELLLNTNLTVVSGGKVFVNNAGYFVDGGYNSYIGSNGVGSSIDMVFHTNLIERLRINNNGKVLINTATNIYQLNVSGGIYDSDSQATLNQSKFGVFGGLTFTATGTESATYINAGIAGGYVMASAGTFTPVATAKQGAIVGSYYATAASTVAGIQNAIFSNCELSSSGTITTLAAYRAGKPQQFSGGSAFTGTITNMVGLYIDDISASSIAARFTNKYGIYQEGTSDKNFFGGEIILGAGQVVSVSVLNTVTNKIKLIVNGTTYYLLASTSAT